MAQKLEVLAKAWFSKNPEYLEEPEPYILTKEEEESLKNSWIKSSKEHLTWRMAQVGYTIEQILAKVASVDWEGDLDLPAIYAQANANKQHALWVKEKRKQEQAETVAREEVIRQKYTASYLYNLLSWTSKNVYGQALIVNDDTLPLIKTVCFFLSGDERFETELGLEFQKGLWLQGDVGLGKTFIIKCLQDNEVAPISIFSMVEITQKVKESGLYTLPQKTGIIYFDDVGSEESTVKYYGTNNRFFKDFIEQYYLNNPAFNKLIVSTNVDFDEVERIYTARVRSRVREMFNIVNITGEDLRK